MLQTQGQIYAKNMAFYVPIGCVRFARYCCKMYSRHLFRTVDCVRSKDVRKQFVRTSLK